MKIVTIGKLLSRSTILILLFLTVRFKDGTEQKINADKCYLEGGMHSRGYVCTSGGQSGNYYVASFNADYVVSIQSSVMRMTET